LPGNGSTRAQRARLPGRASVVPAKTARPNKKGRKTCPFCCEADKAYYFDAAGAAAEAEADESAAFLAFLAFFALAGLAEASEEAAAGAEAGASAAKAVAANRPAIKAAISFFIFMSLGRLLGWSIRVNHVN
jgi:hypothetical protein